MLISWFYHAGSEGPSRSSPVYHSWLSERTAQYPLKAKTHLILGRHWLAFRWKILNNSIKQDNKLSYLYPLGHNAALRQTFTRTILRQKSLLSCSMAWNSGPKPSTHSGIWKDPKLLFEVNFHPLDREYYSLFPCKVGWHSVWIIAWLFKLKNKVPFATSASVI